MHRGAVGASPRLRTCSKASARLHRLGGDVVAARSRKEDFVVAIARRLGF